MLKPGAANRLNKLTTQPALPEGWHKIGPGLWKHDNGEESRTNPSSMFTKCTKIVVEPWGMHSPC